MSTKNFLFLEVLQTEGLFRISGKLTLITDMKQAVDTGKSLNPFFQIQVEPHAISGLVKLFFRELKEPLIPFALYSNCLKATTSPTFEADVQEILNKLPKENRDVLCFLLKFLEKVSQYSETNKMNCKNIGIVWGQNLLKPKVETMDSAVGDANLKIDFVEKILQNLNKLSF